MGLVSPLFSDEYKTNSVLFIFTEFKLIFNLGFKKGNAS